MPERSAATFDTPSAATRETPSILLVDDEPHICAVFRDVLTDRGCDVAVAGDAATALRRLDEGDFDILVTDLRLPGEDGLALARRARDRVPGLMVIMMTAYASVETSIEAIRRGVDDYLIKPVPTDDLWAAVSKAMERRRAQRKNEQTVADLLAANARIQSAHDALQGEMERAGGDLRANGAAFLRKLEQIELINHIAETLASGLDLHEVLNLCLRLIGARLEATTASVMLHDEQMGMLTVVAATGRSAERLLGHRQPCGTGVAGWVARRRDVLLVEDIRKDPRFVPDSRDRHRDDRSFICVPLIARNELVGVLSVTGKAGQTPVTDLDQGLLRTVAGQIAAAIRNAQLLRQQRTSAYQTVLALAESLEAKDPYTSGHSRRVTDLAVRLARSLALGPRETETLRFAGSLHDIGKIGIDQRILNKPAPLAPEEWSVIREHPVIAERIISHLDFLALAKPVIKHHHERWDGAGYPDGLGGDDIPLLSRILSVADAYDAITSARPYRPAARPDEGLREIDAQRASQFDPDICDAFLRLMHT